MHHLRNALKWVSAKQITLFILATLVVYFCFGLNHLTKFETTDESYWIYDRPLNGRIHQYWDALSRGDWKNTFINDKPGVTLAYVSGIALAIKHQPAENAFFIDGYKQYNKPEMRRIYFLFRLPLLIFNGLFSLVIYFLLKKLTGNPWIALWSLVFILLSPIILGISQIINPDSLLWLFSTCTILAFLVFLKNAKNSYLLLSALLFGLSLATKYTALIIYPFLFFISFIHFFFYQELLETERIKRMKKLMLSLIIFPAIAVGLLSLLLPALIADPSLWKMYIATLGTANVNYLFILIGSILGLLCIDLFLFKSKISVFLTSHRNFLRPLMEKLTYLSAFSLFLFSLLNWSTKHALIQSIRKISFDTGFGTDFKTKSFFYKFLLENVSLTFSVIPICLFLVLFLWLYLLFRSNKLSSFLPFSLTAFILIFLLLSTFRSLLITARYSIMLFPLFSILAALGLNKGWSIIENKAKLVSQALFTGIILGSSIISLFLVQPFYFNYSSSLLSKDITIHSAWGYGGYEANQYLKTIPNSQNLVVWTDYDGYCPFIEATCIKGIDGYKSYQSSKGDSSIDYFLRTKRGGEIYRNYVKDLKKNYSIRKDASWNLFIDNRPGNYVSIYGAGNPKGSMDSPLEP